MATMASLDAPHLPLDCDSVPVDGMSLKANRDFVTNLRLSPETQDVVLGALDRWKTDPEHGNPLLELREALNSIRTLPRGIDRLSRVNTFVRVLGDRHNFARLLEILQFSRGRSHSPDQGIAKASINSSKHSIYGWCGQTKILRSDLPPCSSITPAEPGVQELLGKTSAWTWSLSMHIWQVNPNSIGFPVGHRVDPNLVAEPPHSHPFDFVSYVSTGSICQSVYTQQGKANFTSGHPRDGRPGRYSDGTLEHVHGVWPPHSARETCRLITLEDRVQLNAGDSYYLPCNVVHDVEIDRRVSARTPAITLFLRTESVVKPHVYMATEMADYHDSHPELEQSGRPLTEESWATKLQLVSEYLLGSSPELNLDQVVNYEGSYGFLHAIP